MTIRPYSYGDSPHSTPKAEKETLGAAEPCRNRPRMHPATTHSQQVLFVQPFRVTFVEIRQNLGEDAEANSNNLPPSSMHIEHCTTNLAACNVRLLKLDPKIAFFRGVGKRRGSRGGTILDPCLNVRRFWGLIEGMRLRGFYLTPASPHPGIPKR
ncbi:uncharacterized protein BJX67DRAFT_340559 [Aspergillus lucknowensis]|uniref:Uncharacterized protein n=1 Tax=Aspergillus lucknowensis TaxID=176173 RepID=A0ABR4M592_9EURO